MGGKHGREINIYSRHGDSGQVEWKVGFVAVQATAAFSLTVEIESSLRLRMCVREGAGRADWREERGPLGQGRSIHYSPGPIDVRIPNDIHQVNIPLRHKP